ncbi:MAG: DUF389 domain-containing protein [Chloroflexi bacterium]|nr:DUF389 domain-containing protein [Chloroflexota bacterium]
MNYSEPTSQPTPGQSPEFESARARRRRARRRAYFPTDEEGRAALFTHLAHRAFPSYELFVFSLVSGLFIGLGFFLNSQALLIFGVLVAPLMTPWIGISLATIAGAGRFFLQTLIAFLVSSLILFLSGLLAGVASRTLPNSARTFTEAFVHSRLWWPDIAILTIAAIILTISFVRSEERPYLPSALLAYGIILPIGAAGFGLGSGVDGIWPEGLQVFLVHIAWATFFGILSLFFLRFYPTSAGGLTLTGLVIVAAIAFVSLQTGFVKWIQIQAGLATPEPVPAMQAESTPTPPPTVTPSPRPSQTDAFIGVPSRTPSRTPSSEPATPEVTLEIDTPTSTITAEPTPIIGIIRASEGGGAFIREKPGGKVLATLGNGSTVTIVPDDLQEVNGIVWVHVIAFTNDVRVEGWMIQSVLQTATPVAEWEPSSTPETTETP